MVDAEHLRAELATLGEVRVWWTDWDAFVLGTAAAPEQELIPAAEAARREVGRWHRGRFASLPLAVADAVFGRHRRYADAVRTAIRPFAGFFGRMTLDEFLRFDADNAFRLTFDREPDPGKSGQHQSPEGRMRSVRGVCAVLRDARIRTPAGARRVFAAPESQRYADVRRALGGVFGVGEATVQDLARNVGVTAPRLELAARRWLAPRLELRASASVDDFAAALAAVAEDCGKTPFEIDQLVWHARVHAARVAAVDRG